MKILCVAEKPSISKEVSKILSGGSLSVRNSLIKYIKLYDFKYNLPNYGLVDITMTSVAGHITNYDFGAQYSWNACPPGRLFTAPINVTITNDKLFKIISNEARKVDKLMIWTDCDREGEYIGYEILQAASKYNSNLNSDNSWRAQFSHLEKNHIIRAVHNPIKLDMNSVRAVECRIEIDLRCGLSFTRFLTDLYKAKSLIGEKAVVSYGTCQIPTLGFIVDRYHRVKNFIPEPFWYIIVDIKKNDEKVSFQWTKNHFFDKLYTTLLYQDCLKDPNGKIIKLVKKPTSNWRPLPLTTVELQKDCSRFFKMSAKRALSAAENLYNKGWISYPRTETDKFPTLMDLKEVIGKQCQSNKWGQYAQDLLTGGKFNSPRSGNHDDKAHPPIHPVNFIDLAQLSGDDKIVYEYVVRRFLACCSEDAKGEQTTATLKWGKELFTANGLMVLERNYLDIYIYNKWQSSKKLPTLVEGEIVNITNGKLKEGKTSGPQHMTEPELIALMDINGIGTDATIAEHIEKILSRDYIVKTKNGSQEVIIPTELGMGLIQGFNELNLGGISLSKPFLRKNLEIYLQEIVDGKKVKDTVSKEMIEIYNNAFVICNQNGNTLINKYLEIRGSN